MAERVLGLRKKFNNDEDNDSILVNGFTFDNEFGNPRGSNEKLWNKLFTEDNKQLIVSSSPKIFSAIHKDDFVDEFYISDAELEAYCEGVLEVLTKENIDKLLTDKSLIDDDDLLDDSALDDKDIKLSLYRSFKSLYDKWISNSGGSNGNQKIGYFFNNYGKSDDRFLFDHFRFINRANSDVGAEAVIDTAYLANLASSKNGEGPTQSFYQVIGNLLSKNNFDFWPTPSNIPLTTASLPSEDLKDMFRAIDRVGKVESGPIFNCVYIGGSSRTLRDLNNKEGNCQLINMDYQDDSFDLGDETGTDWPEEFKTSEDSGVVVFKVRYGQEAQNHFSKLQLDQQEFKETQESLMVIDALANPEKGNSPSQTGKGNNLFDVYLTRAYNCTVTGLGNMSIQPLMYFKLENVPMFRGTYLINNVKHQITPHNITTDFTGLRQPKITIPIVKDPISLLDLALSEKAIEGEKAKRGFSLGGNYSSTNVSYDSNGEPFIPNKETVDLSAVKGNSSAYVINIKSPGDPGSKKQTVGIKCKKPSKQLEKLPYYDANDKFDIVGTKVPADLFAKEINNIPGLSKLEKRIVYAVARKEQGNPIKCFGNNCFGFNTEGNFSGMDKLVSEGRVLNTLCWVDSVGPRIFPQFSHYKDSVEIFALNQVKSRWIDLTFRGSGAWSWWNGTAPYQVNLNNGPAELNLFGKAKDGSQKNGMKETDSEEVLAAKFVILYYWQWQSGSDKDEKVLSVGSLANPKQTAKTKQAFAVWNESAKYFS